ncbi:MAG: DJ-1 family protein [Desulfobacteraceae bacterium]|nr:DJ-1 family protein [Desulfobacteraceae bacterium]
MEKKILVPIAEGFEMLEALAIVDVFRRAGAVVDIASTADIEVVSSHGVRIHADKCIDDCIDMDYDLVVLPGGIPGAENLRDSKELLGILQKQNERNGLYGAICASPAVVLEHHGLLDGKKATCHPLFVSQLADGREVSSKVVFDKNCITSKGAGTAVDFGLELVGILMGDEKMKEVAKGMALEI